MPVDEPAQVLAGAAVARGDRALVLATLGGLQDGRHVIRANPAALVPGADAPCLAARRPQAHAGQATAGVVHGDLSEFNILLASADDVDFPVIIDLPQAVDAAGNNHAQRMLMRDVGNLRDFFEQFAPELRQTEYGPEIWSLYQAGLLSNETALTGRFERSTANVDMQAVLREIDDARDEEAARRLRMATAV